MKHLNFILAGLFFLCGLCCRAQVLPLEENVVLNTKEGQIKGNGPCRWGENLSVVLDHSLASDLRIWMVIQPLAI